MFINEMNFKKRLDQDFKPGTTKGGMPKGLRVKHTDNMMYIFGLGKDDGVVVDFGFDFDKDATNLIKETEKYGFVYYRCINFLKLDGEDFKEHK